MTASYTEILRGHRFAVQSRHPWASIGTSSRTQGWKLHLSSIITEAPRLLDVVLPVLKSARVLFKVVLDPDLLVKLNEGLLGDTQVGKFATIYPRSDSQARALAERLVNCTLGFHGPVVATDIRLGDIVYARYGGFNPVVVRDRLGNHSSQIRGASGRLQPDDYAIPFAMPKGRRHPFGKMPLPARSWTADVNGRAGAAKLLGPGFLVLEVIKPHPKGSVYRGLDLRDRASMAVCVLKQGREWCLTDPQGRDIRTRLRHQAIVHAELHGRVPIPNAGEYFEVDGQGFLPLEFLRGRPLGPEILREVRSRSWPTLGAPRRQRLLKHLLGTVEAVQRMHDAGYVHRDLNATNVFVCDGGRIHLLDLEISHRLDDRSVPFDSGTPGFVSPQQLARHRPETSDDVHALGALLVMTLTGLDPQRAQFAAPANRTQQWMALTGGVDPALVAMAARCLDTRAKHRPPLRELRDLLAERIAALTNESPTVDGSHASVSIRQTQCRSERGRIPIGAGEDHSLPRKRDDAIKEGIRGLLRQTVADSSGLWLSQSFESDHRPIPVVGSRFELRRSANRGIGGVLYLLGRSARMGHRSDEATLRARRAAAWLLASRGVPDSDMPGLHFGDAGVAVAFAEAVVGGLIPLTRDVRVFVNRALQGKLDWPDLTHGAAGQGIAALSCADRLGEPQLGQFAARCAAHLIETQRPAGHWTWPSPTTAATKGTWTGFAHGVAGVSYFLAEYARRFNDAAAERAWRSGVRWLLRQGDRKGPAMTWPNRTGSPDRWAWWCHGSIGIAQLFLRLYEQTGEHPFADVARRALNVHPPALVAENLSQCHGLAGVGEVYLEAARVLDEARWRERVQRVRNTLWNLRRSRAGASSWLVEGTDVITADLMGGCSGIVHFFLRCSHPGARMGPPLLLDPILE